jgi:uncharacterized protein
MKGNLMQLTLLPDTLAICRLAPQEALPMWALRRSSFFSVTWTVDELSLVCSAAAVPADILCEKPWKALKIIGPLDFSLVGILAPLATSLAQVNISIFVVSTFDTDYLLVKEEQADRAVEVLREQGHSFS